MAEKSSIDRLNHAQLSILRRIGDLERRLLDQLPCSSSIFSPSSLDQDADCGGAADSTEARLSAMLNGIGVRDFEFKRVPEDYYRRTLEYRMECLNAHSIDHLCKSIVMINTQAPAHITDCSDRLNSKYYVVVIQYTAKLNAENIKNYLSNLNGGKIPKKKFNMRLAPEEESKKLTGFVHNAVTCIGMATDIPVILDEAITKLHPDFFWLGGGEVDLKLGIRTPQFINALKPFIVHCSM
ncbi:ybaK/aminoacyl-tRNA synthetase-associated domain-containing protein [Wolffia australiana]